MKKYRVFALFSGGLDSLLAIKWMEKIGYEVVPIYFETPFFPATKALQIAKENGITPLVVNITEEHFEMLKNPKYGYGKHMNPCIDCHGLMFRKALALMEEYNIDFIISGEVLAQRPMSQRKDAMNCVSKLSGGKELIIRPLSQRLLQDTKPITEGWVRKEDLLDIQGRTRKRQLQLAEEMGITTYGTPGGGCLLTDLTVSGRLQDLLDHDQLSIEHIPFLAHGRHFRLNPSTKLIVGRTEGENAHLLSLVDQQIIMKCIDVAGPLGLLLTEKPEPDLAEIELSASIILRYNTKVEEPYPVDYGLKDELNKSVSVNRIKEEALQPYIIKRK